MARAASDAPTPFLTAQWRDLVMLNYAVPAAMLAPLVPAGTILDHWHGESLVSLVGFRFIETRVLGVAIPGHRDFEEINLRFYVRRETENGSRRAVVFISEFVPRRAIAWVARALYNEPYRALPMRHTLVRRSNVQDIRYEWRIAGEWAGLEAHTEEPSRALETGSEAEFITEHYWGYTRQRDGGTVEYHVEHPSWRVWDAPNARLTGAMTGSYGAAWSEVLARPPRSAFVAEGSPVTVFRGRRLDVGQGAGNT